MISAAIYLISCIGAYVLGAATTAVLASFKWEAERKDAWKAGLAEGRLRERRELTGRVSR